MENVDDVLKTSIKELEELLHTKTAIAEPITVDPYTIIPLMAVGFGFGAGGGKGGAGKLIKGKSLGGTGGGAAMRPVAIIVIGPDGVRVEAIKSASCGIEVLAEAFAKGFQQFHDAKK